MRSIGRAFSLVLPLFIVACGVDPSPTAVVGQRSSALSSATVSTDSAAYAPGTTITVTYAGLPGNARDWIAIAAAGSANTSFVAYVYTNGQTSGTASFMAPAAGSYVARAFENDGYTLLAESFVFTSGPTIATDQSAYALGATITVTYAGLPGYPLDWIAIAAAGSADTSFVAYVYTNGQTSGTATFMAPAAGSYVARAFQNNMFTLLAESSPFTVGPTISTDQATYAPGVTITVTYAEIGRAHV